ncbi:MAG TPA: NAD(P)/FAD-dependent oxidoreductase [Nocardioides sp.]|uniref:NAD(P)/FAD-dependent oxidoreductase n=1 Tax=Nocardioides sp. TaxID=35761 RepID=UPI002C6670AF|nr:NAD(P)/FAD-dependent oxidoreductase [Nocardioides sp.]HQR27492.1 NAD(P)/FAD-dependent oxidoreductase [Nocardioides sp.]
MNQYDVAVIGGGAAGLSAAMVLSRAQRTVLVIDAGEPRNAPAQHMHGFLSRDGMPPAELLAVGRREVESYGGRFVAGQVTDARRDGSCFALALGDGTTVTARRVLVTTGLRDELPDVDGLRERWARDVLHCPYCHGYEVRGRAIGVLGWSAESARYAQIVRQWSDDVVLFAAPGSLADDEQEQLAARAIAVVEGHVSQVVVQEDALHAVALEDGRTVPREVLFVPPRFVPNNDVLVGLGCDLDEAGWVVTDGTGQTTVPGVWAAGNVSNPRAQVITAAGEGSTAAIALNAHLVDEDVRNAVREHRRDHTH